MSFFSTNVKYLREIKGLSQNKLAEKAKVNQTTIMRWENGEVSPSLDNIYDVAKALNVSIADLAGKDLTIQESSPEYELADEFTVLFDKHKNILTETDKKIITTIIEERKKEIDEELGEN